MPYTLCCSKLLLWSLYLQQFLLLYVQGPAFGYLKTEFLDRSWSLTPGVVHVFPAELLHFWWVMVVLHCMTSSFFPWQRLCSEMVFVSSIRDLNITLKGRTGGAILMYWINTVIWVHMQGTFLLQVHWFPACKGVMASIVHNMWALLCFEEFGWHTCRFKPFSHVLHCELSVIIPGWRDSGYRWEQMCQNCGTTSILVY